MTKHLYRKGKRRMIMPSLFTENLFDDFFNDFDEDFFGKKNPLYGKHARNMMKTDVRETDTTYEVDVDLPGFKKEDINVNYENGYLTISTSKGLDKDEKDKDGRYFPKTSKYQTLFALNEIHYKDLYIVDDKQVLIF